MAALVLRLKFASEQFLNIYEGLILIVELLGSTKQRIK